MMSQASKVVKEWIGGILTGPAAPAAKHFSAKLDWQENGLPYEKARKKHKRPKWKGLQHPDAKSVLKKVSAGAAPPDVVEFAGYRLTRTEVCSDKDSVVMEFEVGPKGKEQKFCGVFKVAGNQITAVHWYGDPSAFVEMGRSFAQS